MKCTFGGSIGYFSGNRNSRRYVELAYIGFASSTRISIVFLEDLVSFDAEVVHRFLVSYPFFQVRSIY